MYCRFRRKLKSLFRHTDCAATTSGGLGVLSTHLKTPVVTVTTVQTDLLHTLKILTKFRVKVIAKHMKVFAGTPVLATVHEPSWHIELSWVVENGTDLLNLFLGKFTGSLVKIDISLLGGEVRKTTTDTLDLGKGKHNLITTVNVGVQHTKNMLEVILFDNKSLRKWGDNNV